MQLQMSLRNGLRSSPELETEVRSAAWRFAQRAERGAGELRVRAALSALPGERYEARLRAIGAGADLAARRTHEDLGAAVRGAFRAMLKQHSRAAGARAARVA